MALRGPTLFSGYWDRRGANQEDSAAAGSTWATCSCATPDGTLDFVDRAKYLIKSGGENIYPAEIERVILAMPGSPTRCWCAARPALGRGPGRVRRPPG